MSSGKKKALDIAIMFDAPEENWRSMDLAGEMLFEQWHSNRSFNIVPSRVSIHIPSVVQRIRGPAAFNADRALARYVAYPFRAFAARRPGRLFHVVDHSYAQLINVLPGARTGVYCHDVDAFQPLLSPARSGARWRVALAHVLRRGLRSAGVVFYSTKEVGSALADSGLVQQSRLVQAPYGVGEEFNATHDPTDGADAVLAPLEGRRFLLHVGSGVARKRLDVLFEVFARVHANQPELRLVQQGAALSPTQRSLIDRLGIGRALLQPPKLSRTTLAGLYRRASVVLVTSEAEGFGLPVIEAMACGASVIASDLPTLREVGGDAARYAPVADVPAWAAAVLTSLNEPSGVRSKGIARSRRFTWEEHARTLRDAYEHLADRAAC